MFMLYTFFEQRLECHIVSFIIFRFRSLPKI